MADMFSFKIRVMTCANCYWFASPDGAPGACNRSRVPEQVNTFGSCSMWHDRRFPLWTSRECELI